MDVNRNTMASWMKLWSAKWRPKLGELPDNSDPGSDECRCSCAFCTETNRDGCFRKCAECGEPTFYPLYKSGVALCILHGGPLPPSDCIRIKGEVQRDEDWVLESVHDFIEQCKINPKETLVMGTELLQRLDCPKSKETMNLVISNAHFLMGHKRRAIQCLATVRNVQLMDNSLVVLSNRNQSRRNRARALWRKYRRFVCLDNLVAYWRLVTDINRDATSKRLEEIRAARKLADAQAAIERMRIAEEEAQLKELRSRNAKSFKKFEATMPRTLETRVQAAEERAAARAAAQAAVERRARQAAAAAKADAKKKQREAFLAEKALQKQVAQRNATARRTRSALLSIDESTASSSGATWRQPTEAALSGHSPPKVDDDALSVISKATSAVSVHPTFHFRARCEEREITLAEAQHALKHGERRRGTVAGTYKCDDGNVTVVRARDKLDLTVYRSNA